MSKLYFSASRDGTAHPSFFSLMKRIEFLMPSCRHCAGKRQRKEFGFVDFCVVVQMCIGFVFYFVGNRFQSLAQAKRCFSPAR